LVNSLSTGTNWLTGSPLGRYHHLLPDKVSALLNLYDTNKSYDKRGPKIASGGGVLKNIDPKIWSYTLSYTSGTTAY